MGVTTWLAAYTALTVVVAGVWSLTARRPDHRLVLRVLTGLLLVVLILTFSRGGLLAVVVSVSALFVMRVGPLLTARRNISRRALSAAIGFGALGTVALLGMIVASQTSGHATGDLRRVDMWSSSIRMLRDRAPLGIGPGMFGRAYRVYRDPAVVDDRIGTAHNLYLNTVAETGLVGTVVGAWIGIAFVRAWWDQWKDASRGRRFRLEAAFAALLGGWRAEPVRCVYDDAGCLANPCWLLRIPKNDRLYRPRFPRAAVGRWSVRSPSWWLME
jgi:O-antigen ligase